MVFFLQGNSSFSSKTIVSLLVNNPGLGWYAVKEIVQKARPYTFFYSTLKACKMVNIDPTSTFSNYKSKRYSLSKKTSRSALYAYSNRTLTELSEGRVAIASFVENDYHKILGEEKVEAFETICHPSFIKKNSDDFPLLKARLNPRNQYQVKTFSLGKENVYECFLFEGKFHTSAEIFIKENFITDIIPVGSSKSN